MEEEVIKVDGEEVLVREDTAKAFRFRQFAYILAGLVLVSIIAFGAFFYLGASNADKIDKPANFPNTNRQ